MCANTSANGCVPIISDCFMVLCHFELSLHSVLYVNMFWAHVSLTPVHILLFYFLFSPLCARAFITLDISTYSFGFPYCLMFWASNTTGSRHLEYSPCVHLDSFHVFICIQSTCCDYKQISFMNKDHYFLLGILATLKVPNLSDGCYLHTIFFSCLTVRFVYHFVVTIPESNKMRRFT